MRTRFLMVVLVLLVPGMLQAQTAADCDFDGNGKVDFPDFLLFAQSFGKSQGNPGFDVGFDFDGSGKVDFPDFLSFCCRVWFLSPPLKFA